ncbi:vicilin-like seed storage protein At2g18540 [Rhododendron vialii]|uniref:vicilin-like seed storage protein At2g18540 n=1 Tax=Rhododendron vialii TaxID=182163 RepID=UPI00265FB184|nr:vicilin-like seed storage protein At2g18540 [Rhododendron vialii]
MTMLIKKAFPFLMISLFFCLQILSSVVIVGGANYVTALNGYDNHDEGVSRTTVGSLVRKDERESLVSTEYGEISAVEISDIGSTTTRRRGRYQLQFITLEPNALFLPVLLHRDMVFYVHTGSGRLSWVDEDEMRRVNLQRGDVYRLPTGSVFFLQSNLEQERQKLRIYSLFTNSIQDLHEPSVGAAAYSSIPDLVLGFDEKTLQAAFNVTEEVIEEIRSGTTHQAIVHAPPKKGSKLWQFEAQFMNALLGSKGNSIFEIPNKKTKTFNILKAKPDFQNGNGKSLMVTKKKLPALRGSNIGLLMVNLTKGSMMGPHWNPMGSEISIVTQGRGIVRVVCSSSMSESECKNTRFRVEEGDVFVVPRFHPMAQMAFNDDSLVFVGFSTTTKKNHPQFLVGKASVLQTLDKDIVAASFNVTNTTISRLLAVQGESIILECTSCAEEEESKMEEEIEEEKEEARRREEEEAKKREEEERREEEEARKSEEEAKREEEEKRRKEEEEEARKREEEEARRSEEEQEEEERRREEEEQARRREEAAARKREEEEARREEEERRREEEEAKRKEEEERRQEEEEAKRREEEEEEEARRKEEEERRQEEEEAQSEEEERRREEEEAKRREEEEEEARRKEEEERRQEEEEAQREEEEEAKRREEEARRKEEERRQEEEAAKRREEEARRREEEESQEEEEEEEARKEQQKREQAEKRRRQEAAEREEEEARTWEQERKELERQEETARRERERQQEEEEARREEKEEQQQGEKEKGGGSESEPKRVLKKIWKV